MCFKPPRRASACAILGLAGANQVLGTVTSGVSLDLDASIGFDAITVALLGRSRPLGILAAGILFGALKAGAVVVNASEAVARYYQQEAYVQQALRQQQSVWLNQEARSADGLSYGRTSCLCSSVW